MTDERPVHECYVRANGLSFGVAEWPGDEPAVFLAHATSFHARIWDQVVKELPGIRCIAIDMRGHGRSDHPPPPYPWLAFGQDVAAVTRELGLRGALGVGHSKGGHAVINGADLDPEAFAALLLVDPVIAPRERYALPAPTEQHPAARRRNRWDSWEEMYKHFAPRPPFDSWDPLVLRDYCKFGLVPRAGGDGFELACPPEIEALLYSGGRGEADPYDAIARVGVPVRILRASARAEDDTGAGRPLATSTCVPDLVSYFRDAEDVYLPQHSHFIPMEAPGLVASHARELRERLRAAEG